MSELESIGDILRRMLTMAPADVEQAPRNTALAGTIPVPEQSGPAAQERSGPWHLPNGSETQ